MKRWLKRDSRETSSKSQRFAMSWLDSADNPWGMPVLDLVGMNGCKNAPTRKGVLDGITSG